MIKHCTTGLVVLLVCFLYSIWKLTDREIRQHDPETTYLRFAHTFLEDGAREAFDALAQRYMEIYPNVVVEQAAVPRQIYPIWLKTKIFGGNVPDLVELKFDANNLYNIQTFELLNYFTPLSKYVDAPNPYNRGTALEKTPWRDTFFDGLSNRPAYDNDLLNYFGIPTAVNTVRIFYNRRLMTEIMGDAFSPPRNHREFIEVCRRAREYGSQTRTSFSVIAGDKVAIVDFFNRLFGSQTQKLDFEVEPTNELQTLQADALVAYVDGAWSLQNPEVFLGLELVKETAAWMTPGFLEMDRNEALFQFLQERSLMMVNSAVNARSIAAQAGFPIDVFRIPMPAKNDAHYGGNVLGTLSEAETGGRAAFGVYRFSSRPELAVDFLRFVTSLEGGAIQSKLSGWPPVTVEVDIDEAIVPFKPVVEGYRGGFNLIFGSNTRGVYFSNLHRLLGPGGSVVAMLDGMKAEFREAAFDDLEKNTYDVLRGAAYFDSMIGALWELNEENVYDVRISEILESQNYREEVSFYRLKKLRENPP